MKDIKDILNNSIKEAMGEGKITYPLTFNVQQDIENLVFALIFEYKHPSPSYGRKRSITKKDLQEAFDNMLTKINDNCIVK